MSRLNDALDEAQTRLMAVETANGTWAGRVVIAYNEEDLLDLLKGIKTYPAVGIVYEGMRSQPESGSTAKVGVSADIVMSFILVEQGDAVFATAQKKTRAIDYLDLMRDQFMGIRSTATGHFWHFLVEAPAELKAGMVVWVQRWSVPVQLPPR